MRRWLNEINCIPTKLIVLICCSWFLFGLNVGLGFSSPIVGILIIVFTATTLLVGKRAAGKDPHE